MNRHTQNIRPSRLFLAAVLACPALAMAVDPPRQPIRQQQPGAARDARPANPGYTPEDLKAAVEFMSQHAPNRLRALQALKTADALSRSELNVVNQKRNFDRIQRENNDAPKIYELKVREFEINDEIFNICQQIKSLPKTSSQQSRLDQNLNAKVQELFDLGIQERQVRIDRLERMLANQKRALENDQKHRDDLVTKNFAEIANNGVDGARYSRNAVPTGAPDGAAVFSSDNPAKNGDKKK